MKKLLLISVLATAAYTSYAQSPTLAIRNYVLGIYTGTYLDYATYPDFDTLQSGVKMTALPNDTAGIIFNDTINNIIDTLHVVFTYLLPDMIPDTSLDNCCNNLAGMYNPARDSLFLSYYPIDEPANPSGEFILKCIHHDFPTIIKEWNKSNLSIYPNPAIDKLYVSAEKNLFKTYSIYTIYGQVVDIGIYNSTIEIGSLPVGMYYLKLSGKTEAVKSFIKN